jgi:hypothetical protein
MSVRGRIQLVPLRKDPSMASGLTAFTVFHVRISLLRILAGPWMAAQQA